jgi:hypothetical protein
MRAFFEARFRAHAASLVRSMRAANRELDAKATADRARALDTSQEMEAAVGKS